MRHLRFSPALFVGTLALLSPLLSCGPDFEPYWKVDRLRIIAIQADPVVALHDEETTLRAAVWAPSDDINYHWSWCPLRLSAQDDYTCPVDGEQLAEWTGQPVDEDFFDLGDDAEATFQNPFEPQEVEAFCKAIEAAVLDAAGDRDLAEFLPGGDCSEGFEVSLRLTVSTADEELVSAKRFHLDAGTDDPNQNPTFVGLQLRPDDPADARRLADDFDWPIDPDAPADEHWLTADPDPPLPISDDIDLEWRGLIDADTILTYSPPTPRGSDTRPEPRQESYTYRHFTTLGDIDSSSHLFSPRDNTVERASNTTFRLSSDDLDDCLEPTDQGCLVRLWTVARDSRLGQSWTSATLELREAP